MLKTFKQFKPFKTFQRFQVFQTFQRLERRAWFDKLTMSGSVFPLILSSTKGGASKD